MSSQLILPPPEIRQIIDKTALFVAKSGPKFEETVREREEGNPRFSFLGKGDVYWAYYQAKLKEGPATAQSNDQAPPKETAPPPKPEIIPTQPLPLTYILNLPQMAHMDLEIMKLAAQYVARNGRHFAISLAQREAKNYQFDFLRPTHSLAPVFSSLIEMYTRILTGKDNDIKTDIRSILNRASERYEWEKYVAANQKKAEAEAEAERIAFAEIDWHDFVVVGTIEFTPADETADLAPPQSRTTIANLSLAQKQALLNPAPQQPIDPDVPDDIDEPVSHVEQKIIPVTSSGPFKIRDDYKPAYAPKGPADQKQICPRCRQAIPINEMDEHIRIELLDPKWKTQQTKTSRESNLVSGPDVGKHLKEFARQTMSAQKVDNGEGRKVIWDGHAASAAGASALAQQGVDLDKQIEAIHRNKGLTATDLSNIGPRMPHSNPMDSLPDPKRPKPN